MILWVFYAIIRSVIIKNFKKSWIFVLLVWHKNNLMIESEWYSYFCLVLLATFVKHIGVETNLEYGSHWSPHLLILTPHPVPRLTYVANRIQQMWLMSLPKSVIKDTLSFVWVCCLSFPSFDLEKGNSYIMNSPTWDIHFSTNSHWMSLETDFSNSAKLSGDCSPADIDCNTEEI